MLILWPMLNTSTSPTGCCQASCRTTLFVITRFHKELCCDVPGKYPWIGWNRIILRDVTRYTAYPIYCSTDENTYHETVFVFCITCLALYYAQITELGHECPAIDQSMRLLLRATYKRQSVHMNHSRSNCRRNGQQEHAHLRRYYGTAEDMLLQ